MIKFEVGKTYIRQDSEKRDCIKRTDKSVWFDDGYRLEVKDNNGREFTTTIIRVTDYDACNMDKSEINDNLKQEIITLLHAVKM